MTNLGHLEKVKKFDEDSDIYHKLGADEFLEYRKVKAFEIIAEELINLNNNSGSIITALENVETILNRR